ncbi:unnamed protein product [Onchocerca flexuosa]|uniref:histone acetyltransferase n=1 Tax=Onchocerca flexuosa TaxID=387005 RepID=A0A183H971_9BILA|nr:unnamed protein product [Onchocerca flexuosa]
MGNLAYRSYWRSIVLEYFKRPSSASFAALTLEDIAKTTGVSVEDIMQTMKDLEMLHIDQNGEIKSLIINKNLVESHWAKAENDKKRIWIDEDNLKLNVLCLPIIIVLNNNENSLAILKYDAKYVSEASANQYSSGSRSNFLWLNTPMMKVAELESFSNWTAHLSFILLYD